jgi:hypothetical protein
VAGVSVATEDVVVFLSAGSQPHHEVRRELHGFSPGRNPSQPHGRAMAESNGIPIHITRCRGNTVSTHPWYWSKPVRDTVLFLPAVVGWIAHVDG